MLKSLIGFALCALCAVPASAAGWKATTETAPDGTARLMTFGSDGVLSDLFDDPLDGPTADDTESVAHLIAAIATVGEKFLSVAIRDGAVGKGAYVAGANFPAKGATAAIEGLLAGCPEAA